MQLVDTEIDGVYAIELSRKYDARGFISRIWDSSALFSDFSLRQASMVVNPKRRTLRGLHYQKRPFEEKKLILCLSGCVFDVVVDLRCASQNYGQHLSFEIGPESRFQGLLVPANFAHGYITLRNDSNLMYFMDKPYSLSHSSGIRWNSSCLSINWPVKPRLVSAQDQNWPEKLP